MIKNDMRRLLFKGKKEVDDKGVEEWVEGSLVSTENEYFILQSKTRSYIPKGTHTLCSVNCYEVNKKTICQYTGFEDKNKCKIWEKDIVNIADIIIGVIVWNQYLCGFCVRSAEGIYTTLDFSCLSEIKVIGNIVDDPDLLKKNRHMDKLDYT